MALDYSDRTDFDNAERGFIATLEPLTIKNADGRIVFDLSGYSYLDEPCPETVHPSLFRQAQLCVKNGLFEVTDGIYQIRGFDISNMTIVEGDTGVIVIDPMISAECAAAGLALYREHRGDRPVTGLIYTHSHADHFGGVMGVLPDGAGDVPIIAPEGFLEHAVSENVYAGTAMNRRANYQYGYTLDVGPEGQASLGLGIQTSGGSVGLIPPTVDITRTGQEETVDGVRIVFQITPGTEAPSEMNFHFPGSRALCVAENATHNLHNILTLRGALVRDPRIWSHYLDEAVELFAPDSDVVFASHHWPTWGSENIVQFLTEQRDMYAYLHDQTLRMVNIGLTGSEIAEAITLPASLDDAWHVRGYYGSVSHNVKAIYQRYMGWFDGHPSSLWQHPPEQLAARYVDVIGGVPAVLDKARGYIDAGDTRFAAELLKHAVFAEPDNTEARNALADLYTTLGYGAENPTWRGFYLTGAKELRGEITPPPIDLGTGMAAALTVEQLFDTLAIRVNGPRAGGEKLCIEWIFTDLDTKVRMTLSNGALIQTPNPRTKATADLTLTLTKAQLLGLLAGGGLDGIEHSGDPATIQRLLGLLDSPDPAFAIVTP
ncbi:alkyl/aryl-sulfatase [Rhodococcus sp. AD45-ID]|jgi:alkyl sulfatase BDS1-like metallo-beta-lactamase superfamily hydrolase|uniref:Alkyl sulfatase dimerization domain-containing protein n=1 Tax=Rhodococcus globerulus TaxID=33008 RepID=A0ABU4BN36_RHOGO|nr:MULTISPECIES: alkyl sulfatase dimerization domain-containing protein [Rhodococcus]KJF22161.1 Metallo-beta-lactamase superfamily protein [Rhodococcus sp. AD45]MCE4267819.1 MBL fold metallo-hydrolase [Rhodococcus globerulus]MDV6265656.1 alkyl sulfatase dimerization domain-containing protein [Rhodococcus globerulus]MDV8067808.1 alkyl sulfatase dimerization domain-containing protein [Rhodococcus sp. IEGM 1366]PSR39835.1 alkyl/aryl-sulfatase [Rhodococcus sp. AD45-ID]